MAASPTVVRASSPPGPPLALRSDPLWGMPSLGARASRDGLAIGVLLAMLLHTTALGARFVTLYEMRDHVAYMRQELHGFFWAEYEIDVVEPAADEKRAEEKPEPETEAEAEPEPAEPDPAPTPLPPPTDAPEPEADEDPYPEDDPPAPAEAADVVAHDEGIEIPGMFSMPDKDGSKSTGGGMTSSKGTSKKPVYDKNAKSGGREGGKGTGEPKKRGRRRTKNLSRSPRPVGSLNWNCPFPPQADLEQIDHAVATVSVTVGPDGRVLSARVVSDPGYGFGQMAQRCAMSSRWQPGLDADGNAITSTTPPVRVTFNR